MMLWNLFIIEWNFLKSWGILFDENNHKNNDYESVLILLNKIEQFTNEKYFKWNEFDLFWYIHHQFEQIENQWNLRTMKFSFHLPKLCFWQLKEDNHNELCLIIENNFSNEFLHEKWLMNKIWLLREFYQIIAMTT